MSDIKTKLRVLIVEDCADDAALVLRELRKNGYEPHSERVETATAMRSALSDMPWDIILSDYLIPGFGGIDALKIAKASGLDLPFILVTGKVGEDTAVEAMKAGAADFVMKDRLARLGSAVKREMTEVAARKQGARTLHKVNRALKALGNCNQVLIHATDEMRLLNDVCRVIVDDGGYRLAWVGYAEHDAQKTVRPVAHAGCDEGYLATTNISWADSVPGRGPSGTAIRTGTVQVNQNLLTNPNYAPWREAALARDFQSSIALPFKSSQGVFGALTVYAAEPDAFNEVEVKLLQELADDFTFGIETLRARCAQERSAARLLRSLEATILAIAATVEMRDAYTAGHQRRVAELATAIARDMGLAPDQVHGIYLAAVVHDLGKIKIPAEILSKPGKLSRIEFELIKTHPEAGYDILKGVDFPWPIARVVLQHHERVDGSGYPSGLKGNQILLEARILMVADVVEAMASHRPYRAALGIEPALQEIVVHAEKYDANVVRRCIGLFREKAFAFKE